MHAFRDIEKVSGGNVEAVAETAAPLENITITEKNQRITFKAALVGYTYAYTC